MDFGSVIAALNERKAQREMGNLARMTGPAMLLPGVDYPAVAAKGAVAGASNEKAVAAKEWADAVSNPGPKREVGLDGGTALALILGSLVAKWAGASNNDINGFGGGFLNALNSTRAESAQNDAAARERDIRAKELNYKLAADKAAEAKSISDELRRAASDAKKATVESARFEEELKLGYKKIDAELEKVRMSQEGMTDRAADKIRGLRVEARLKLLQTTLKDTTDPKARAAIFSAAMKDAVEPEEVTAISGLIAKDDTKKKLADANIKLAGGKFETLLKQGGLAAANADLAKAKAEWERGGKQEAARADIAYKEGLLAFYKAREANIAPTRGKDGSPQLKDVEGKLMKSEGDLQEIDAEIENLLEAASNSEITVGWKAEDRQKSENELRLAYAKKGIITNEVNKLRGLAGKPPIKAVTGGLRGMGEAVANTGAKVLKLKTPEGEKSFKSVGEIASYFYAQKELYKKNNPNASAAAIAQLDKRINAAIATAKAELGKQ